MNARNPSGRDGRAAIDHAFARAAAERRAALIAFLVAGDPDADACVRAAVAAAEAGADIVELGLPYADSLADGPVIQAAYARALARGVDTAQVIAIARRIAREAARPVVLMSAYNAVRARGVDRFVQAAAEAGIAGLLVPDLPPEDATGLRAAAERYGLAVPLLVAPDTTPARAAHIARQASGFIYALRRRGVTGAGGAAESIDTRSDYLRAHCALPIAVGFGIATAHDVADAVIDADGVIVGSALVAELARVGSADAARAAGAFIRPLAQAARRPEHGNRVEIEA